MQYSNSHRKIKLAYEGAAFLWFLFMTIFSVKFFRDTTWVMITVGLILAAACIRMAVHIERTFRRKSALVIDDQGIQHDGRVLMPWDSIKSVTAMTSKAGKRSLFLTIDLKRIKRPSIFSILWDLLPVRLWIRENQYECPFDEIVEAIASRHTVQSS